MSLRSQPRGAMLLRLLGVALFALAPLACGDDVSTSSSGTSTGAGGADGVISGDIQGTGEDVGALDGGGIAQDDALASDDGSITPSDSSVVPDDGGGEQDSAANSDGSSADASDGGSVEPVDCPGGAFCDCETNDDCDSAFCIDTPDGKKCAKPCVTDCPGGYTCTKYGSTDAIFLCLPDHLTLCAPCLKDGDCKHQGANSLCLDYGPGGKFCGSGCNQDKDCPKDYGCIEVKDEATGSLVKQCKLTKAADGSQPVCDCTKWASALGAKTSCSVTNTFGSCTGERGCGASGLTACNAPTPVTDLCDNLDNDCDGTTDNLPAWVTCSQKAWFNAGSKSPCKVDADCTEAGESCEPASSTCRLLIGECMGKPMCDPNGQQQCTGVETPKAEMCNGADDDCDGQVDEDYFWVSPVDQAKVAIGGACGLGSCAGGTVKCDSLSAALCDAESKKSKETCDGDDNDCDGAVDEETCDDGDLCTQDVCDAANADCSNPPAVECDDKNGCTADSCDSKTGKCVFKFTAASCDDGDACTVGDKCVEADDGAVSCLPGATTQSCDDDNVCTDDSCDSKTGCVHLSNAVTVVCYTAQDPTTAGKGKCKKGTQFCKDGKLEFACVGEVLPKLKEACDGTDDDCDGQTDEGCKSAKVDATFATSWATVQGSGGGKIATMELGGSSPAGTAKGPKKTAEFGFISWVIDLLKK